MQDEPRPDVTEKIDEFAPRFEALGLSDIAARLRALSGEPEPPQPAAAPQLGALLEQQLLSILDQTEQL